MKREFNSTFDQESRYVSGGTTEVNSRALEWWERNQIPINTDDRVYVVERKFEGRLDLIAATYTGSWRHWWYIAMYNNILDAHAEIREGVILYIPTTERIEAALQGKIGGVQSKRELRPTIIPII
jgi:hypothetical protein